MASVVFFDLVGTLIRPRSNIGTQYASIARRFGIEANASGLDLAFRSVLAHARTLALPDADGATPFHREKQAWRAIVDTVFRRAGHRQALRSAAFDDYFEALFDHFATDQAWVLYRDAAPSLAGLRRSGLRVGLITNFDSRVYPLLDRLGLASVLDSVTIPALAGAAKPDAGIFRFALAANGARAADAVSVGDSVAEDVLPARHLGMTAILIDRGGHRNAPRGVRKIRSLLQLSHMIQSGRRRTRLGQTVTRSKTPQK